MHSEHRAKNCTKDHEQLTVFRLNQFVVIEIWHTY